jgi:hypothetical protein
MNKNQIILIFRVASFTFLTFGYVWYIATMVDYHSLIKYFSLHAYFMAWIYFLIVIAQEAFKS